MLYWYQLTYLSSRKLLRILIDNLSVKDVAIQSVILDTLTEIFKRKELEQCWCNFVELLTLRVLNAHCEENKDVSILLSRF